MNKASLVPRALRCEHVVSPLGVQRARPRLTWELAGLIRGARPTAFRVMAAARQDELSGGRLLWDSGKIVSSHHEVIYGGRELVSGERVYWRVMLWDEADRMSPWSEAAFFEMGFLSPEDWQGEWIGAGDPEMEASPFFRREFETEKKISRARAYFSGLGYGELYVNGALVGEGKLTPGWTNYDRREYREMLYPYDDQSRQRVLYLVHDITSLICTGRNALGCVLGNGMHHQRVRTVEGKMWYGPPRLLLNIVLEFEDGSVERINSDRSWKWSEGALIFNNVFTGEIYDARRELPDTWAQPGFDDSGWKSARSAAMPAGRLCSQLCLPDTVIGSIPPVVVKEVQPGLFILDFGRIVSGWLKLTVQGPEDARIVMRFAENVKADGSLDTMSAGRDYIQRDEFILAGRGTEVYEPRFVWHCFRYAEISGWPEGASITGGIEAKIVCQDTPGTGEFSCSHPMPAKIIELFRATQLYNQHGGVPSDCPHRERLGYTGDAQIAAEAVMWNFDAASFYAKWIDDLFDAQNGSTGFIPHTVPFYGGGGGPGWGSAGIIVPWHFYNFYGDVRILADNYGGMVRWLDYLARHTDERGVITGEEPGSWCLGDWSFPPSLETGEKPPMIAPELVNTFYYGYCAELLARMAKQLGRHEDAEKFRHQLEKIRSDFHNAFFDPATASYGDGVGGADAFALLLGAVPESELSRVRNALLVNSTRRDTGIFGMPVVIEALMQNGGAARAFELMTTSSYPSFGYMLDQGATTIWEVWSGRYGSHCHPMFGSVATWMYRWVAGLDQEPGSNGFERLIWKPWRGPEFTWARLSFQSVRGPIELEWRKEADGFHATIDLPPGSSAKLFLPGSPGAQQPAGTKLPQGVLRIWKEPGIMGIEVGSGRYEFVISAA